ncbi:MAG: trehalose-phosphatase [Candidatus Rokubacteria bacterium]|nr:trehalose-phosphatase [Candidatus Rokubacteria bacterium]
MRDLARIFSELAEGLATGVSFLLLTDYDGTLTPLVGNPAEARLSREVRDDLRVLAQSPHVRVGILSGRDLRDLRARVGIPNVVYAGCHGLEVEGAGISFRHPEAEARRPAVRALARALRVRSASIPGMRVEAKELSVAVHYRTVSPQAINRLEREVAQAIRERWDCFTILRGKKVIEILPRVPWNKGECALWIRDQVLAEAHSAVRALYVGDDRTDELVFEALAGKAITVKVGSGRSPSAAAFRLSDVSDVHRLLSALAAEVSERVRAARLRPTTRSVRRGAP